MASHRLAVAALAALALAAGSAAVNADQPSGGRHPLMQAFASKLGLSQEQQQQMARIHGQFAERAEPIEEQLWKVHHEELDAVKGVLTSEQREKLPSAIKAEMGKECRAIATKLGLSDDQRQKVQAIRDEYEPKFREVCTQSSEDARKRVRQLRSEFIGELRGVLTDDQKAKFPGVLRQEISMWRDPTTRHEHLEAIGEQLGLNGEQRAQIRKIHAEYKPRIEREASQLKDIFREERSAMGNILNDEQRAKAREMWQNFAGDSGTRGRE
jgi:Spy/CpxP family protein refolding chaperone